MYKYNARAVLVYKCVDLMPCVIVVNGSTSVAGGLPGLQNRWGGMRNLPGGFDSHVLPPIKIENV